MKNYNHCNSELNDIKFYGDDKVVFVNTSPELFIVISIIFNRYVMTTKLIQIGLFSL